jgi:hypothetical protein
VILLVGSQPSRPVGYRLHRLRRAPADQRLRLPSFRCWCLPSAPFRQTGSRLNRSRYFGQTTSAIHAAETGADDARARHAPIDPCRPGCHAGLLGSDGVYGASDQPNVQGHQHQATRAWHGTQGVQAQRLAADAGGDGGAACDVVA